MRDPLQSSAVERGGTGGRGWKRGCGGPGPTRLPVHCLSVLPCLPLGCSHTARRRHEPSGRVTTGRRPCQRCRNAPTRRPVRATSPRRVAPGLPESHQVAPSQARPREHSHAAPSPASYRCSIPGCMRGLGRVAFRKSADRSALDSSGRVKWRLSVLIKSTQRTHHVGGLVSQSTGGSAGLRAGRPVGESVGGAAIEQRRL